MGQNIWQYRGGVEDAALSPELIAACGDAPFLARLLYNRGIHTPEDAAAFLNLEDYQPASGWDLPDMEPGVARILQAIDAQEPILIFGDFDVDGITGTAIFYQTLQFLNARVTHYIPDRATEGHGLNVAALCRLVSTRNIKLVISTDTGITNFNEVSLLNGLGVDTVITDHHALPENLPPAIANINPQLMTDKSHPLALLCGAGVAFKVCERLLEAKSAPPAEVEALLDLVAIGTVADLVPLQRENRYLVHRGVQVLNRRQRLGVQEILEQAGVNRDAPLTSETIGFTIGPRLNAIGRLDKAGDAVELLTTSDPQRARIIGAHLEALNRRRQELCETTLLDAEKHLSMTGGLDGRKAIILASPDWHLGVIGIVASRLIEKYHVPVFLMVIDESKGEARCSARSIRGFNLHEQLSTLERYFLHFGGHSGAAGFALKVEHLESFKRDLYALAQEAITEEQMRPIVEVDAKLAWSQLNEGLVEMMGRMAPFGKDNPPPRFVLENVSIAAQRALGAEKRHLKLILAGPANGRDLNHPIEGLLWNFNNREKLEPSEKYGFVVAPELNTFNNVTKVQLIIQDYRLMSSRAALKTEMATPREAGTSQSPLAGWGGATAPSLGVSPKPLAESPLQEDPQGPHWVDHRSREGIESFVGQLMLPLQDGRDVVLYHEGKKPDIPFLSEGIIVHRQNLRPAEELILWDVPPDLEGLQAILNAVQPQVLHLVGGKYQSVPVFPVMRDTLKVLYQVVHRMIRQNNGAPVDVTFSTVAAQLSTTATVITNGLILLGRLGVFGLSVGASPHQVRVALLNANESTQDMTQYLEFVTFQQALQDVGRFRSWILQAPVAQIKESMGQAAWKSQAAPSGLLQPEWV